MTYAWRPKTEEQENAINAWQNPQTPWWKQPKVWGEAGMQKFGETISKVPVLPKILEKAAPAFEFIHEKLEKPFASFITAPFSPSLSWRTGESWIEHEKREYAAWRAPTYIKGLAEFAMPLWWVPYLGWTMKGARALGVGNKMARTLAQTRKAGKVVLPTKEALNTSLYKMDFFKKVALWAEDKPLLSGVVRAVGGPSAFVRGDVTTPLGIVQRELVNRAVITDMRHGARGLLMPRLQKYGDVAKLLDVDESGLVRGVTLKKGYEDLGRGLSEVIEHPEAYLFKSPEARNFVLETRKILSEVYELAEKEGVKVPKELMFHRMVKGKELPPELQKTLGAKYELSEYGSLFEVARHHKTMEAGVKAGVLYSNNPLESIASTINHFVKKIATKRFDDEVGKLGKTPLEKFGILFPDDAMKIANLGGDRLAAEYAIKTITRLISYRGSSVPPATMAKIRKALPEVADRIEDVFAVGAQDVDKLLGNMGREIWQATKIKPREFKAILANVEGRTLTQKIANTIRSLNISSEITEKSIERVYKAAYQANKREARTALQTIQQDTKQLLDNAMAELKPLKQARSGFLGKYREGKYILGEAEAKFTWHPAFRGRIFPKEVVEMAEPALRDRGNTWIRGMGQVSGTGRMLIAAMDFSAPFIQGLAVMGRNPVAWLKGVMKQFEFFVKPENLQKYMTNPEVMAIAAERVMHGGSRSSFEFFEALGQVQRGVGKIPKVGKYGKRGVIETYGRAEAAFTGFGEVARNEMWKALRRPNMSEVQLRELARSIDRMTGVMSTEALAIGMVQRDFENAFVFFAPRYTRAGLSYVSDVLKGGLTGAEARKSLGSLMAGGFAMYYGISTVLGQRPNLDPKSAKFLTVKIGDDHIGIGGILYALMRFQAGVIATAAEEPLDLVRLNRFDNPFIKFMFNRTAPLTGLGVGAMEQKNFFGEPFESLADWGRFMAEKVLPIAMQRAILEEGHRTPAVFGAEIMGGRTFPKSEWELREEAREKYAMERHGQPYEALPDLYKREIDAMPDVKLLQEEADRRTTQRGEALSVGFINRQRDRDDARFMYVDALNQAQAGYDAGLISGRDFREMMQEAGYGLGATYKHIDTRPEYQEVMQKLQEPQDISKEFIGDIAYQELVGASYSGQFEDQYGIFDYDAYNKFREDLRLKYGDAVYQYILDREAQGRQDLPPLAQEYYASRDIMKPYWDVERKVIRLFGKRFAESSRGKAFISKMRKQLRMRNPMIERYYQMFYARA